MNEEEEKMFGQIHSNVDSEVFVNNILSGVKSKIDSGVNSSIESSS